uniref:phosphoribosylamine--glycine ligase n=1 Tax=Oncorhynchus tshawytscha TaxID=74940 RepID=A0A8C8BZG3_ONCTS
MAEWVLVIGNGGREHTLAWKLAQSPHIQGVLVARGMLAPPTVERSPTLVSVSNHTILAQFCKEHSVGLVVVGPEVPLAAGECMVDDLQAAGVQCFGPSFSTAFMDRHGLPTARWCSFTDPQEACSYIRTASFPALVVKASGLAAGKGVIVAKGQEEACQAVLDIMKDKMFGSAGETVVVEELLDVKEVVCVSVMAALSPMPPAQDHKSLQDGDLGPNTGGMGAYCPTPQEEGAPYVGLLYAGLMLTKQGPKVLELNCRFGDPECQVGQLCFDLYEVLQSTLQGKLASSAPVWHQDSSAVTVVMASPGYPGSYKKGVVITGRYASVNLYSTGIELSKCRQTKCATQGGIILCR